MTMAKNDLFSKMTSEELIKLMKSSERTQVLVNSLVKDLKGNGQPGYLEKQDEINKLTAIMMSEHNTMKGDFYGKEGEIGIKKQVQEYQTITKVLLWVVSGSGSLFIIKLFIGGIKNVFG